MFHLPSNQACEVLGVGLTIFKRICRKFGLHRWPYRTLKKQVGGVRMPLSCKQPLEGLTTMLAQWWTVLHSRRSALTMPPPTHLAAAQGTQLYQGVPMTQDQLEAILTAARVPLPWQQQAGGHAAHGRGPSRRHRRSTGGSASASGQRQRSRRER